MSLLEKLRLGGEVALVLGLVAGAWQYIEQREDFARAEARAEQRAERINSLKAHNDSLAEAKAAADSAARRDSIELARTRRELQHERERAEAATGEALAEADTSATALEATHARIRARAVEAAPRLVPLVDTAQAQLQAHLSADSSAVEGFHRQIETLAAELGTADSLATLNFNRWQRAEEALEGVRQELREQREQTAFWKAEARPGFLETLAEDSPKLLGAALAGAGACAVLC